MGYRPPKGVRPPQLEGKRTGRPKGSKSYADAWADVRWAYDHRYDDRASPPSRNAFIWWGFACAYPDELEEWLNDCGKL